ncbi:AbrB family transcriptional regulator [Mesorhizobium sp. M4B.F.Ca.ET.215.01.1.1]|uniref:AbrB family transcriptional regulator n=1 Tax=unclassified Mesorhizobium TaxID=325217 RepID=UPI000FCAAFA4|nr:MULTISPECIES: AbrB family transcriptional regulator [unclassified Mesorhizobium]RUW25346.1 AbrB family transcriptional regulator [Mesorhizobium sp. M4B.F.Ca.ET.013.02.1.1]RVD45750.1 AbrB family transcriptional regulator [Mesorhizobium sp. M4B.F.Ca.ET.019.03.1.1]RWF67615.1 MAG: AbrB family transcriptional regulator [Mesorhizobium sp.]TGQ13929.1 AbrB family transcriptional regulator [Mesorhizobium sp. M4B.F.Ca.ET.215.01.1.1]TGQ41456.1 AbrB family transcriptional regulator [Mesorhizobium sp. M
MDSSPEQPPVERMARLRPPRQWLVLLALSLLFAGALEVAALPAALLIGPMLAAILAGTNGATVRVPRPLFGSAQAVVGCLVAASISADIFPVFYKEWPLFLGAVIATVAASSLLGWLISRWRILPGTTAVWGSSPGAATAMVLMAGAFGADQRLVAFMQYLRVIFVSMTAALIARMWVDTSGIEAPAIVWFPPIEWKAFAAMLAVALVGGLLGRLCRLPSPFFLGTFIFGTIVHLGFGVEMQLPQWLLAVSYALIGWSIGLNFTRPILRDATRALPQIIGSIVALIAFCGGMAFVISRVLGIDPLTAYLATSPGGMDSVAIIAAAAQNVDISFVMALQSARFLVVLLVGPSVARLVARSIKE